MNHVNFVWPPYVGLPQSVGEHCVHLLAPNADLFTYEGTNTWIVGGGAGAGCIVIDPGSEDPAHLKAIIGVVEDRRWTIDAISATHLHEDHTDGALELSRITGADVFTFGGRGDFREIRDGDTFDLGGTHVEIIHTPGHTDDSITFRAASNMYITGDTVLSERSSAVYGNLRQFFRTLDLLREFSKDHEVIFLPGHGPIISEPNSVIDLVAQSRIRRLNQISDLVDQGFRTPAAITDQLYPDIESERREDAEAYVASNLSYLFAERETAERLNPN